MENKLAEALKGFTSEGKPEFKARLVKPVSDVLEVQIKNELYSANLYKAMASWCSNGPWSNAYKLFMKYGNEEIGHADKIIEYLDDKNCKYMIPDVPKPPSDFKDIRDILTKALEHEIGVTANWENIANVALANKDNTTYSKAKYFIDEQVEEEVKFRELLYMIDLGMPDWMLDLEIGKRI